MEWNQKYIYWHPSDTEMIRIYQADKIDKEIERLRKTLAEYGHHKANCRCNKPQYSPKRGWFKDRTKCTCGFREALKGK